MYCELAAKRWNGPALRRILMLKLLVAVSVVGVMVSCGKSKGSDSDSKEISETYDETSDSIVEYTSHKADELKVVGTAGELFCQPTINLSGTVSGINYVEPMLYLSGATSTKKISRILRFRNSEKNDQIVAHIIAKKLDIARVKLVKNTDEYPIKSYGDDTKVRCKFIGDVGKLPEKLEKNLRVDLVEEIEVRTKDGNKTYKLFSDKKD
jgi:hypothetical protein